VVQDLVTAISAAPPAVQRSKEAKDAQAACADAGQQVSDRGAARQYLIVLPQPKVAGAGRAGNRRPAPCERHRFRPSRRWVILTNRHVVEAARRSRSPSSGESGRNVEKSAEVVAIDDVQDSGLIRVKSVASCKTIQFAPNDRSRRRGRCTVDGIPAARPASGFGENYPRHRQQLLAAHRRRRVLVDCQVNPATAAGAHARQAWQCEAIVCMKKRSSTRSEDTYGMGISAGKIREFLTRTTSRSPRYAKASPSSTEDIATRASRPPSASLATESERTRPKP